MNRRVGLDTLPYDLLLNIASHLDLQDLHAVQSTCRSLYEFSTTRPVYREVARELLRRCRALPLKGFQRITDLTTEQLLRSVNKAARYEIAWRHRGPIPMDTGPQSSKHYHSNYMDDVEDTVSDDASSTDVAVSHRAKRWYRVVSAPPSEEVDWLSPITSSYTLCATKSGKVVCWDVQTDTCLAQWNPGERWELWKCRVEFEEKTVFFTMAKIIVASYDDARVMDFVLMKLCFSDSPSGEKSSKPPIFSHVADFKTSGVVMNVFLLDPSARLLSAFVWLSSSGNIGLYVLLDWDKPEYVFIDTGIDCVQSSNWSCILFDRNIVVHCEESDGAYQYFYPLHVLQQYKRRLKSKVEIPALTASLSPTKTIHKDFIFPSLIPEPIPENDLLDADAVGNAGTADASTSTALIPITQVQTVPPPPAVPQTSNPNPFPFPPWCPDSAHFVRQWWPSLPGIPRVSCTVVLLSAHDPESHRTRFVLAQHYFRVPLSHKDWAHGTPVELRPPNVNGHADDRGSASGSRPGSSSSSFTISGGDARFQTRRQGQNGTTSASANGTASSSDIARSIEEEEEEARREEETDDALMRLWYVSSPFEVVCVLDSAEEDDEAGFGERPRPLVAVDFGHAVWIEFVENEDEGRGRSGAAGAGGRGGSGDSEAKWLRFVTFPPFDEAELQAKGGRDAAERRGGEVRTLEIPEDLDLDSVETINIDQSQGAVILSVREGKIFILCYE